MAPRHFVPAIIARLANTQRGDVNVAVFPDRQ
jgi:hypothetical protein